MILSATVMPLERSDLQTGWLRQSFAKPPDRLVRLLYTPITVLCQCPAKCSHNHARLFAMPEKHHLGNSLPGRISLDTTQREQVYVSQHGQPIGMWKVSEPLLQDGQAHPTRLWSQGFSSAWVHWGLLPVLVRQCRGLLPGRANAALPWLGWMFCLHVSFCT